MGNGQRELVPSPRHRGDGVGSDDLAQRRYLHMQRGFLDHGPGPYALEQFGLADEMSRAIDERHQQVECARAQRNRRAVPLQPPFAGLQLEGSEALAARDHAAAATKVALRGKSRIAPRCAARRRNLPGVVPTWSRKSVVKWLWQEHPISSAMSARLERPSARSFIAFLMRQRLTYRCGVIPVVSLKRRPKS